MPHGYPGTPVGDLFPLGQSAQGSGGGLSLRAGPNPNEQQSSLVWGSFEASPPDFPHFPHFGVCISAFSEFWNLIRPCFSGVRGTFRIFRISAVSGSNR